MALRGPEKKNPEDTVQRAGGPLERNKIREGDGGKSYVQIKI